MILFKHLKDNQDKYEKVKEDYLKSVDNYIFWSKIVLLISFLACIGLGVHLYINY